MSSDAQTNEKTAGRDAPVEEPFPTIGAQAIDAEDTDSASKVVSQIESLCMNCEENVRISTIDVLALLNMLTQGTTRLLLTKIPFFREIILSSFACEHCGFEDVEIQSAGDIQEHGLQFSFRVEQTEDLQRQIIKSDTAICRLENLDLEIPAGRGRLTNIEGLIAGVAQDLAKDQETRKQEQPEVFQQLERLIQTLTKMTDGSAFPFSVSLDDPAGNSSIEPSPNDGPRKYRRTEYKRTVKQNAALGLGGGSLITAASQPDNADASADAPSGNEISMDDVDILEGKAYSLPCDCPGCSKPGVVNMQMLNIPYFKQVVVSAISCELCGYKSNEVKTGGEVPAQGKRIWLTVKDPKDLSRDLLKSETCYMKVPSCSLEVQPGTMGGRFTTVEGLLTQVRNDLRSSIFDVDGGSNAGGGDSMSSNQKEAWDGFFSQLDKAIRAEVEYEILLEDPLANSYVQSFTAPEPDPQLRTEDYDRTGEEEEDLGLADMRTVQNEHGEYVKEPVENPKA